MSPAIITLIVLGIVALLFVTEAIPLAIAAMGGAIALGILGVIPITQVFSGLSNSTVILFAGMFVIGGSMFHTGLAQKMGETVVKYAGKSENGLMFAVMLITAVLSAVSSNTGTTAALMPVIIGICAVAKISASRQLMPLAFAAGLGGIITLVGTPPNIIAAGALKAAGFEPFGFFEFAWIGIPLTIAGMLYMMFIGKHLLPKMEISTEQEIEQEIEVSVNDPKKMWISGIILLAVVIVMGLDLKAIPLEIAAIIGAILAVLTGCLKEKQAYHSIDWVTIFLFAGMMPIAAAMEKSGAGKMIADIVVNAMGGSPSPMVVTASLFILSCGLTQFMSNTASTALLAPIGISIAKGIGASPHAVLMAIAVAASCAFATPVGTPPNTLVLGPGGYKFMDYVKAGSGLVLVCFIVSIIIIPMVWPFFPK
ncbi:SLC13 family permease [Pelosinus fermentans]|uniref:Anion transporter n=2 Tax=Pelosinus TaxID=365348 RepID=I9NR48_9FIRM|nr:SLC13 family permease [Pelosinus fermentans]AJQ27051.1 anion transporter [Pelosinus fermentans JBW45]